MDLFLKTNFLDRWGGEKKKGREGGGRKGGKNQ